MLTQVKDGHYPYASGNTTEHQHNCAKAIAKPATLEWRSKERQSSIDKDGNQKQRVSDNSYVNGLGEKQDRLQNERAHHIDKWPRSSAWRPAEQSDSTIG